MSYSVWLDKYLYEWWGDTEPGNSSTNSTECQLKSGCCAGESSHAGLAPNSLPAAFPAFPFPFPPLLAAAPSSCLFPFESAAVATGSGSPFPSANAQHRKGGCETTTAADFLLPTKFPDFPFPGNKRCKINKYYWKLFLIVIVTGTSQSNNKVFFRQPFLNAIITLSTRIDSNNDLLSFQNTEKNRKELSLLI